MATDREIIIHVLTPMLDLYKAPDGWVESAERLKALRLQYVTALAPYAVPTLQRGWNNVVARHYGWSWPTLQEIIREMNLCS